MVEEWRPSLVALDIDGTLLIPDFVAGHSAEQTTQPCTERSMPAPTSYSRRDDPPTA